MYLIIDIGNTNIVFAVMSNSNVSNKWRVSTDVNRTSDEYFLWLSNILKKKNDLKNIVIGSVVPEITNKIKEACSNYFNKKVFIINEDININFPVDVENEAEVGTDRLVNSLAAWNIYQEPCIIIDFGTATTFDIVDKKGKYVGGLICPGINLSLNTLHSAAARLPRIALTKPKYIIGKTTVDAMTSGIYFGYVGLIKYIIEQITKELSYKTKIILTGGLANLFSEKIGINNIIRVNLTIEGLYLTFIQSKKNKI